MTLSGDGGLAMLLGDLLTLRQIDLPAKVVVFNNGSLGLRGAGDEGRRATCTFATELQNPDFAAVAAAMGIRGMRVEDSGGLDAALTEAFAHDGPALVEVMTDPQELTLPPAITLEQVKGFALYSLKTVLSGRGDELFDLARTNLRQLF